MRIEKVTEKEANIENIKKTRKHRKTEVGSRLVIGSRDGEVVEEQEEGDENVEKWSEKWRKTKGDGGAHGNNMPSPCAVKNAARHLS